MLETDLGHDSLRALFGGEPLTVRPDAESDFRVEGTAWLRFPGG